MSDVYSIHNFGPSDLLSSDVEHRRRVKTASMSAADVAALNSTLYSFSAPYMLAAGESVAYNVQLSGEVLVHSIQADGLLIDVHSEESAGVQNDVYKAFNHNLVEGGNFTAFMQRVLDYQVNGFTIKSCASTCAPSVVSDVNHPFSFTTTNNTGTESSGVVSLTLESIGDFVFPYGLTADTQLTAATEMVQYA